MKGVKCFILILFFLLYYVVQLSAQSTAFQVSPEESKAFSGHYEFSQVRILKVTQREGRFFGELSGSSELELTPSGPGEFYLIDIDKRVTFNGEKNNIRSLTIHREPPEEARKINLSKYRLKKKHTSQYIGDYEVTAGNICKVYFENNNLRAIYNGEEITLVPLREHLFYSPERIMKIGFNKDFNGKISSLTLYVGQTKEAIKL